MRRTAMGMCRRHDRHAREDRHGGSCEEDRGEEAGPRPKRRNTCGQVHRCAREDNAFADRKHEEARGNEVLTLSVEHGVSTALAMTRPTPSMPVVLASPALESFANRQRDNGQRRQRIGPPPPERCVKNQPSQRGQG
jgi:hypothetical protein